MRPELIPAAKENNERQYLPCKVILGERGYSGCRHVNGGYGQVYAFAALGSCQIHHQVEGQH